MVNTWDKREQIHQKRGILFIIARGLGLLNLVPPVNKNCSYTYLNKLKVIQLII
jgi:hypothetical protein